jgi:Lon protease-like protein
MTEKFPLFPLPSVVLFPKVEIKLNLFEKRYLEMFEHVLQKDQRFVLSSFLPGWEDDYYHTDAIEKVACLGKVIDWQKKSNDQILITFYGEERIKIDSISDHKSYREALIHPIPEHPLSSKEKLLAKVSPDLQKEANNFFVVSKNFYINETTLLNSYASRMALAIETKQELLKLNELDDRFLRICGFLKEQPFQKPLSLDDLMGEISVN